MKKILVISAALLALSAPLALAGGLDLTWNACASNGGASSTVLTCNDPSGLSSLFGTFISDVTLAANFVALDLVIDLQTDSPTLPDFWNIKTPVSLASCNDGVLLQKVRSATTCSGATNPWGTGGGAATANLGYGPQFGGVLNRGRIVGNVFRSAASPTTINAGTNYYGFELQFLTATATEAGGSCAGCPGGVTIVFNQALLNSIADARTGIEAAPVIISNPGNVSNCATSGGSGTPCAATPTHNKTWGALKSLYR